MPKQGHSEVCAIKLAIQVDGYRPAPVGRRHRFNGRRWPGDAGVVDQRVETAELLANIPEQTLHLVDLGDVGHAGGHAMFATGVIQRCHVDVADVHARTITDERADDRSSNACCARRDEHTRSFL